LGAPAYYLETFEKIYLVNELDRDRTGSGFCPVLDVIISCVESFDPPIGMYVSHVC